MNYKPQSNSCQIYRSLQWEILIGLAVWVGSVKQNTCSLVRSYQPPPRAINCLLFSCQQFQATFQLLWRLNFPITKTFTKHQKLVCWFVCSFPCFQVLWNSNVYCTAISTFSRLARCIERIFTPCAVVAFSFYGFDWDARKKYGTLRFTCQFSKSVIEINFYTHSNSIFNINSFWVWSFKLQKRNSIAEIANYFSFRNRK